MLIVKVNCSVEWELNAFGHQQVSKSSIYVSNELRIIVLFVVEDNHSVCPTLASRYRPPLQKKSTDLHELQGTPILLWESSSPSSPLSCATGQAASIKCKPRVRTIQEILKQKLDYSAENVFFFM